MSSRATLLATIFIGHEEPSGDQFATRPPYESTFSRRATSRTSLESCSVPDELSGVMPTGPALRGKRGCR